MIDHDHHHHHGPEGGSPVKGFQRELLIALGITAAIMVAELIGGLLSNSLALLSDAAHMFTDVLALLLSILAFRFSTRPPTRKTTFGFHRLEIFAAQINAGILVFLSIFIFYEAYKRFLEPEPIKSLLMMIVAAIGLGANMASALILHRSSKKNLNVRASFLHIMGDLLSSAGVIVGGFIIHFTGWFVVDPILSVLIGLVILRGSYSIVMETANVLLEAVPKHVNLEGVIQEVEAFEGVQSFHHVHVWTITSGILALSGHVLIEDQMLSESAKILEKIEEHLRANHNINHTTLQFECESCEGGFVCKLERD
jgi:cobalt-zinc-cadmium efflux system protein